MAVQLASKANSLLMISDADVRLEGRAHDRDVEEAGGANDTRRWRKSWEPTIHDGAGEDVSSKSFPLLAAGSTESLAEHVGGIQDEKAPQTANWANISALCSFHCCSPATKMKHDVCMLCCKSNDLVSMMTSDMKASAGTDVRKCFWVSSTCKHEVE
eukprot:767782-Hanusia_phi.AAC.4